MTRILALLFLLAGAALAPAASAQSLWREGAATGSLFHDHRARTVDDIVTILVTEQSSSSRTANTSTSKETRRAVGVTRFPTAFDPVAKKILRPVTEPLVGKEALSEFAENRLNLEVEGRGTHQGKGSIDRTDRMTAQIAARVVKVFDNGNLLIEGRRAVLVNDETQVITISGIVRPQDISGANTVLSSQIADAEIQMVGRGLLAEAQRPGVLYRFLDWLRLF